MSSSKIDTQGMSAPLTPEDIERLKKQPPQTYKPMVVTPRRLFTPEYVREMKILINEILDKREGKSGISYFDTIHFRHPVTEDEPPYEEWK